MEFENEAQRRTYELVSAYMSEIVEDVEAARQSDRPAFRFMRGSALTDITVVALEDTSVVGVSAWVVTQIDPSPELFEFLVRANYDVIFGAFAMDGDNDIVFHHRLFGETLDQEELLHAAGAVSQTADEYDDVIISRFGGLRAADR